MSGQLEEAQMALTEVSKSSRELGSELMEAWPQIYLGAALLAKGQMTQGLKMLEEVRAACLENKIRSAYVSTEYILGKVYSLIALVPCNIYKFG